MAAPTRPPRRTGAGPAKRGRPRRADADEAILAATLELLAEAGVAGLSMDVLAQRAGVGKATIYRRWDSKEALILDALRMTATADPGARRGHRARRPVRLHGRRHRALRRRARLRRAART